VDNHGQGVLFLNFEECLQRLNKNLLSGQALRAKDGSDNGVRLLDVNNDGYLDVGIGNDKLQSMRVWRPALQQWSETALPIRIIDVDKQGTVLDAGIQFGVLRGGGRASLLVRNDHTAGVWHFEGGEWRPDKAMLKGLDLDGAPLFTSLGGVDQGVRLRDLDGDGRCEVVVSNPRQNAVFSWDTTDKTWQKQTFGLPQGTLIVDATGRDAGLRFVDIDEDGHDDVVFSNQATFSLHLFDSMKTGWSRQIRKGKRGDSRTIPMISRWGTNNGAWFSNRTMWIQNEDTAAMPDGVDRRTFAELLGRNPLPPKSAKTSLNCIELPEGFQVELVAAEPLIADPVGFDWGPDGRLWVVEMGDYPEGTDGEGKPGGRVRILEDTDRDGIYDQSTLFLDGLPFPTG
ncbi:MAG: FG-GAP-like repeat-containing protein, partial [Planctomycetales bacterium]